MVCYGKRLSIMRKRIKEHRRQTSYIAIMQKPSMISLGSPATCAYTKSRHAISPSRRISIRITTACFELGARTVGLARKTGSAKAYTAAFEKYRRAAEIVPTDTAASS